VSVNLSGDRRSLLIHGLAVADPEAAARRVKERYERPLMEIFE
jgi:multicomponent K+:H+ antiporter subunit E